MADVQTQAEGQQEEGAKVEDQFAKADEKGAVEQEEIAPPSVEDLASKLGWMPKEKYKGDEVKWKPADQFILDSGKIQAHQKREIDRISSTLDTVAKTSASILQERLAEQRAELESKYQQAVDAGDKDAAWQAANGIIRIDQQQPQRAPNSEALEWSQRNPKIMADPLAAQRAVQLCEPYARQNWTAAQQLSAIEPILKREFPHLFETQDTKPPPAVAQPTRMNGAHKKGQGYSDLPNEAKAVADDYVERGMIKAETPQAAKEIYARNYFAMQQKGK